MRRSLLAACLLGCVTLSASAIPPASLTHYDLIPRRSVLLQTGGIAGLSERYRLIGDYDFLQDFESTGLDPVIEPVAYFDNAEVWGTQILPPGVFAPAIVLDVDELLNLEGLRGELLPLGAPFDVYRFRGSINDGGDATSPLEHSTIELYAAILGRWMFLYGETTPPPGSADFFEYTIKALARRGPWADFNEDGVVDAADYTAMRDAESLASGASLDGVTAADWLEQFGETLPDTDSIEAMFAGLMESSSAAVPEPGVVALVAIAAVGVAPVARTRRTA